jgi:hypothetical protein
LTVHDAGAVRTGNRNRTRAAEPSGWKRQFDDPIPAPRGRQFVTLEAAGNHITKLPKAEHETVEWRAAMEALSRNNFQILSLNAKPAWAEVWHLWTVIIPRRSITGRLVFGKVWRRHDGHHWIHKKFIEYAHDRDE